MKDVNYKDVGICSRWFMWLVLFVFLGLVFVGSQILTNGVKLIETRINQQSEVFNAFK